MASCAAPAVQSPSLGRDSRPIVQHLKFPLAQLAATCKLRGGCLPTAVHTLAFVKLIQVNSLPISRGTARLAAAVSSQALLAVPALTTACAPVSAIVDITSLIPISSLAPLANISTTMRMVAVVVLIWIKTALRGTI
jgi:hypothetical protein